MDESHPAYARYLENCRKILGVETPDADALHFNAQRLRNVAKLVGLEKAVPQDDATLDGARGAVLGQIARKLRDRQTPALTEEQLKALHLYRPPFRHDAGIVLDAANHVVLERAGDDAVTHIKRGADNKPDPETVQNTVADLVVMALNDFWTIHMKETTDLSTSGHDATSAAYELLRDLSKFSGKNGMIGVNALVARATKILAATAPSEADKLDAARYTCIGKGGEYKRISMAIGAGTSRGADIVIYEGDDGVWYFRTADDFAERMTLVTPAQPAEVKS